MARMTIRVTPRARRDAIEGIAGDGHLRVRVTAAPADGAANEAVCALLASPLGIARSHVRVTAGATSRIKTIDVLDLTVEALKAKLASG